MSLTGEARFVSGAEEVHDMDGLTSLDSLHNRATLLSILGVPSQVVIEAGSNPDANNTQIRIMHLTQEL